MDINQRDGISEQETTVRDQHENSALRALVDVMENLPNHEALDAEGYRALQADAVELRVEFEDTPALSLDEGQSTSGPADPHQPSDNADWRQNKAFPILDTSPECRQRNIDHLAFKATIASLANVISSQDTPKQQTTLHEHLFTPDTQMENKRLKTHTYLCLQFLKSDFELMDKNERELWFAWVVHKKLVAHHHRDGIEFINYHFCLGMESTIERQEENGIIMDLTKMFQKAQGYVSQLKTEMPRHQLFLTYVYYRYMFTAVRTKMELYRWTEMGFDDRFQYWFTSTVIINLDMLHTEFWLEYEQLHHRCILSGSNTGAVAFTGAATSDTKIAAMASLAHVRVVNQLQYENSEMQKFVLREHVRQEKTYWGAVGEYEPNSLPPEVISCVKNWRNAKYITRDQCRSLIKALIHWWAESDDHTWAAHEDHMGISITTSHFRAHLPLETFLDAVTV